MNVSVFHQRLPFLPLVATAVAGIAISQFMSLPAALWLGTAVCAGAWFLLRHNRSAFMVLCVSLFALLHLWQSREMPSAYLARWLGERSIIAKVTGVMISEAKNFSDKSVFDLRVGNLEAGGIALAAPITLQVEWAAPPPAYGDKITLKGSLANLEPPRNPGQFDFAAWSRLRGIYARLQVATAADGKILATDLGNPLVALALQTRTWMRNTLTQGIDDAVISDLLVGMVLGETSTIPERIQEQFRGTGTFHLFSVSGLHVGILAVLLWQILKIFRVPRRKAAFLIIPLLFFYALMTGFKPASVRAALMASIVLLGFISNRQPVPLNSLLAAAFLILLWDTNQLFNAGFQLSFCVVAAILVFERPVSSFLARPFHPDPFFPEKLLPGWKRAVFHSGQKFATLAGVSTAAWAGSLPLTLGYFHLISFTALPANLVVVPISFAIMAVAMLSLLGGLASAGLAVIFNQTNWLLSKILLGTVSFFASLPGSYFFVKIPQNPVPEAEVVVFDFGAGAASFVEVNGRAWLIDSGPAYQHDTVLLPFLRSQGLRTLDGLILSHGDAKHIGAGIELLASCQPRQVIDSVLDDQSSSRQRLHERLASLGLPKSLHRSGDVIPVTPGISMHVLHPPAGLVRNVADDKTLVIRLDVDGTRLLFMSDAGLGTEHWLLENTRDEIRCDILIKGSARSGPSGDLSFIKAANPLAVIATAADFPESEKIPRAFAGMLAKEGIVFFRQDQCGAVRVRIYKDRWEASAFLGKRHYIRAR